MMVRQDEVREDKVKIYGKVERQGKAATWTPHREGDRGGCARRRKGCYEAGHTNKMTDNSHIRAINDSTPYH